MRIYPKRLLRLVTGVDVTNAADGLDSLNAMHLVAKFFSQVTNVRVDAAIERRQFAMQHIFDQLFAGQDTARGIQQFLQQGIFNCREFDWLSVAPNRARPIIHLDITDRNQRSSL